MSKNIAEGYLIQLPSGLKVHPCRLIHRDGTLMWKHALLFRNELVAIPETQAQEAHIIKTAQRLEELNTWASQGLEPWEAFIPSVWFKINDPELKDGISCYFTHSTQNNETVYEKLKNHVLEHETLEIRRRHLFFKRC